jgi:hypothetical protein
MIPVWPDLHHDPVNLYNAPANMAMVPDADCGRCKYGAQRTDGHFLLLDRKPGNKCSQFREANE